VLTGKRRVMASTAVRGQYHAPLGGVQRQSRSMTERSVASANQGKTPLGRRRHRACNGVDRIHSAGGWEVGCGLRGTSGFWRNERHTGEFPPRRSSTSRPPT